MDVEVNLVGVAAATVAAMVVGSVWYHKAVFGTEWMKLTKISDKKAKEEAPQAMFVMFVLAALAAYALAWLTYAVGFIMEEESFVVAAVQTAMMVWVGFVFYAQVSNAMFEQRPKRLMVLNVGNSFVTFLAMGLAIGLVGL